MVLVGLSLEDVLEIVPDFQDKGEKIEEKANNTLLDAEALKKEADALLLKYKVVTTGANRKLKAVGAYRRKVANNVLNVSK